MRMIKVGHTVYRDGREVVARFTHGAWYKLLNKNRGPELEPCTAGEAQVYDQLPDALVNNSTPGESQIVVEVLGMLEQAGIWKDEKETVIRYVDGGIKKGLISYGPYDPLRENRNLMISAIEEARNLVVYCAMHAAQPNLQNKDEVQAIGAQATQLIVRIDRLIGDL